MIAPPISGSQHFGGPSPLLDPTESPSQAEPRPSLLPLSPAPTSVDLLRNPGIDAGSCFRHSGWAPVRRRVATALATAFPDTDRFRRFGQCGSAAWVVVHPDDPRNYRVMADFCHDRYCVPCARLRARTILANLLPALPETGLRFVTLTLRSETGDPLRPLLDKLYRCFALLRRRPWWLAHVAGGVAFVEVKFSARARRWHPHLHVLVQGTWLSQPELSSLWRAITRDSYVVDVRLVRSGADVVRYVTKYVSKPGDFSTIRSTELLTELMLALAGRRLCSTFGSWARLCLTARGEPVDWQYVDTLGTLIRRASEGDSEAVAILRILHCTPDADEPVQRDLPFPDS